MNKKKIFAIWATAFLLITTLTTIIASAGANNTHVYVIPQRNDIEIGNTTNIRLLCNTTQPISGWQFQYLNFTAGVVNISKVRTGHYSPSGNDYYIFQDNSTVYGKGPTNNITGVIGGSWAQSYYEADIDGGWVNSTNRTIVNLTAIGMKCGRVNITIFADNGQIFVYSGITVPYTYHQKSLYIHPIKPSSFSAVSGGTTQINITLTKAASAYRTIIRGKLGSYPTGVADGTWGVNTTFQRVNHTGLNPGENWYYKAWSWNETAKLKSLSASSSNAITGAASHYPISYLITPKNQTTGLNRQPKCRIWANDTAGGTLTLNFYENSTGSWIKRQKNSSVTANSTVQWNYSQSTSYNTKYYWRVTVYDGSYNSSYKYYFTTKSVPGTPTPSIYLVSPKNQTSVGASPTCTIWANDTQSVTMTINFYANATGTWTRRQTTTQAANQTATWTYTDANESGRYYWKVTIYDGTTNISRKYWFTCMVWHNTSNALYFTASKGGGLNFISSLEQTNASNLAADIGGSCSQLVAWNATTQSWDEYLPGISPPSMSFSIYPGASVGVEVTTNTTAILEGYEVSDTRSLYYTASGGGGLNWIGRTVGTTNASQIASHITPSVAVQLIQWNKTIQGYKMFIVGVDKPGGINDFSVQPGVSVCVEVTANATLSQSGW